MAEGRRPESSEEMLREAAAWLGERPAERTDGEQERAAGEPVSRWRADPTGGIVRQPDPNRPGRPGPGLERYRNELSPAAAVVVWGLVIALVLATVVLAVVTRSLGWTSLPVSVLPLVAGVVIAATRH